MRTAMQHVKAAHLARGDDHARRRKRDVELESTRPTESVRATAVRGFLSHTRAVLILA
jgi:hypothetical protein